MLWDEKQSRSEVESVEQRGFDSQALLDRSRGDLNSLQELVDLFGTEAPKMLAGIEEAIHQASASELELEKAAHKTKNRSFSFSAHAAANIALHLAECGWIWVHEWSRDVAGRLAT